MTNDPNQSLQSHMARIDSHQHFWLMERGDYDWLTPDIEPLYRDFMPDDLRDKLSQNGIDQTVLVQAAETNAETDFMLSLAERTDFISGVVGWVDMESKEAVSRLTQLGAHPLFKGIRPMIQDLDDDQWMLRDELEPVFLFMIEAGLCFDALVKPRHLENLYQLLLRYPELKVVVDHAAKPDIASGNTDQWESEIQLIARETQACCKLSGLITEAGAEASFDALYPTIDHLLATFGAKRLMWGSDWPVLSLAADYQQWVNASSIYISKLPLEDQEWIWSKSAQYFYGL